MEKVVEMQNVSVKIQNKVILDDVSCAIDAGHVYGFVGRNGSGKSMLFKTIVGFIKPCAGKVIIQNRQLHKNGMDFAPQIGFLIEHPGFLRQLNAYQNLDYFAGIKGIIGKKEIERALLRVHLDPGDPRPVRKYSLGMQQKLAIAQAVMENHPILIFDEPMNSLDQESMEYVKNIILEEREIGKTILLASHNPQDILTLCDRTFTIDNGRLIDSLAMTA
jgi:ABC-2 type transport system ATP-binding protein